MLLNKYADSLIKEYVGGGFNATILARVSHLKATAVDQQVSVNDSMAIKLNRVFF
jgi:hypothetical protein